MTKLGLIWNFGQTIRLTTILPVNRHLDSVWNKSKFFVSSNDDECLEKYTFKTKYTQSYLWLPLLFFRLKVLKQNLLTKRIILKEENCRALLALFYMLRNYGKYRFFLICSSGTGSITHVQKSACLLHWHLNESRREVYSIAIFVFWLIWFASKRVYGNCKKRC